MSLREVQRAFSSILSGTLSEKKVCGAVERLVRDTGPLSPMKRMEIYRDTGLSARANTLHKIYPVCKAVLGDSLFDHLARGYSESHASLSPDLNLYSDKFADYIAKAVRNYPAFYEYTYLQDLCVLEWLWHTVYYRENDDSFDFSSFTSCSEKCGQMSFTLSRSLELMVSVYPVHLIWKQHLDRQPTASVPGLEKPDYLCIYRKQFSPLIESISKPRFELLKACRHNLSLAEIADDSRLSVFLTELPALIRRGWICGFRFQPA